MNYWHCDECNRPLPEWDAPCPRCNADRDEPSVVNAVILAVAVSLVLFSALFL